MLHSHLPNSGFVGASPASPARATFNCAFNRGRVTPDTARLWGAYSGAIFVRYPQAASPLELLLQPEARQGTTAAYLPGERVTVWLSGLLGDAQAPFQPFLWQFMAAVATGSPGTFRAGESWPTLSHAQRIALGDLDRDGDLDAVVSGEASLSLLRNHGDATFDVPDTFDANAAPLLGDMDGDGDLDIADSKQVLLNDGEGLFSAGPTAEGCVALGDLDGDGDLDCVANLGYQSPATLLGRVLLNAGDGSLRAGPEAPFGFDCDLWDLDGDGDLDATCVSPVVSGVNILFNEGQGHFRQTQTLSEAGARGIALGDVDSDGDVDLVVSLWFGASRRADNLLYINDGRGRFKEGAALGNDGGAVALADIDGNGSLDFIYSHLTPYGPMRPPFNPSIIVVNDGRGHFTPSAQPFGDPAFQWFKLGDLDGDGDLDAFVFHQLGTSGSYSSVWLNRK